MKVEKPLTSITAEKLPWGGSPTQSIGGPSTREGLLVLLVGTQSQAGPVGQRASQATVAAEEAQRTHRKALI